MLSSAPFRIHRLAPDEVPLLKAMLTTFGEAFGEAETNTSAPPSAAYLERLLME